MNNTSYEHNTYCVTINRSMNCTYSVRRVFLAIDNQISRTNTHLVDMLEDEQTSRTRRQSCQEWRRR